jgi:hypothetical protein
LHSPAPAAPMVLVLPKFASIGAVQSLVHPSRYLPKRVTLLREFLAEQLTIACDKSRAATASQ